MSEKQVGRLIYIEPNDIPKETLNTFDGTAKSISNITWNPEDLNIYVDLQVICPKRTDCGNDPFDSGNISNKNDLNERNYISLLEGIKLNKDDKFGSLTTNYTNISYSEILNSSASDREALGISSIDITFDAHFYPRVTINFVDVRGYSLFMPAEEVYETGIRNEAARNEETKDLYESTNRAYSHFFSSVFHFPYPRFILTVKGVYGTKVSFILAVDTFKSSLNSHTGNFDVAITFIGYMYGLYTDIPMTYLLIAPYIEPFSETSDENGLIRSKYWEECGFKSAEDTPLPTFLEFLEKYKTVLLQLSSNQLDLGSETESYNNLQQFVASLDEILKDSEDLFNSVTATTGTQVGSNLPIKPYKNNTFSDNVYKLFTKSNEDTTITLEWDKDLASKLYNKIKNTNSTYQSILGTNTISQNFITEFYKKTDGSVDNKMTLSTTLLSVTDKITFATNNTTAELTITSDDKEFLKNLNTIDKNQLGTYYIFGMDIQKTKVKLTKLIEESKNEINQLYSKASENAAEVFEDALGFRMSIENIYRMIFAHLQCFFHEYIDNTITKIATDTNVKRHVESDFGISLEDTDIDSKDENPEAPPFFALYEGKDEEKTLAYPGTAVYGRAALGTIHEVTLVDKLLNAAKLYRENFDVIRDKIEGLTLELNSGEEDSSLTTNTAAITTFNPIYVYEVLFGDINPYSHLNNNADIYSILYHAGLRLYIAERLGYIKKYDIRTLTNAAHTDYKTICPDIIEAEVENIVKIFPTLDTRNYTETEFDNIVEDKIFDYGYMYKCISENTSLFMTLATSQFNTMDSSLATDEARRNILNNHKTEFIKYINDNVLYYDDSSVFSKFTNTFNNKIKSKILSPDEAFTSFDSTIEIREGSDSISSNALNKLYEVKENNNKKDTYNGIINQLPTSDLDKYTVPFLVWESDNKLVNMFESPSFQNIEKEVQAFFILLSIVVSELTELIDDAYNICGVSIVNNNITYYIHSRCKCLKIRFVTALFFGALEYAYSNDETKKTFAKYGILIYDGLRYKLNEHLFKHNTNSDIIVRTFKSTLNGENWEHSPLTTFADTHSSHPTSEYIDKFYSNFLQGDTVLLNLFKENVTTTGDLLNNILSNYVDDIKYNSFGFDKDKHATQLRTGGDSYQEDKFEGMKFLNKGCNTDKNLVDLLTKTCTLIFTDAYTNYSPKSNITDTESFKKYFKKVYIQPILAKLGDMAGEPTDDTETTNNKSSNTKSGDNNDLKKSLYYTLKNLYDKWICSYGNMNRFKLPSTYQEEKNNKEKKYVNGEAVNSISEINNFIFVDAFYRDISNDFLVNPDTLVEIIEQSLSSRQFNFSVYQFMALICEKNKLLFRSLPVYNNFTDTDSLKNIFKPNNLYNHKTPQENNFSPTYLIMYTHQPSAHLNISTKKGINYRDDGFDLAGTIAPKQFESCNDNQHINYKVPAFGVTYGMQNQNYFKSININMDNPITTDYAILNQIQLAERAVSGDLQHPIGIGQNIYSIYSNRSYNCTVEMLGCANIMPMMYFQLNNIPMFKGAYMIVSVKHSIKNGSMTTTFTGVRQSSALQGFTTSNYLLSKIIDVVNSNAGNNTTRNTGNQPNRSDDCGTYDLSWADNITL